MNVEQLMNKLAKGLTEGKIQATDDVLLYADELREPIFVENIGVETDVMNNTRRVIIGS
jgi:hypothetical protein